MLTANKVNAYREESAVIEITLHLHMLRNIQISLACVFRLQAVTYCMQGRNQERLSECYCLLIEFQILLAYVFRQQAATYYVQGRNWASATAC